LNFIDTETGMLNVDHVVAVRKADDKRAWLVMVDGSEELASASFKELSEKLRPLLPNTTAIQAVEMVLDEDDAHLTPRVPPVIGWRMGELFAEPLLPDGETATHLIFPDGRVEHINNGSYPSLHVATLAFARDNKLKLKLKAREITTG
jgi:hypothetical protein